MPARIGTTTLAACLLAIGAGAQTNPWEDLPIASIDTDLVAIGHDGSQVVEIVFTTNPPGNESDYSWELSPVTGFGITLEAIGGTGSVVTGKTNESVTISTAPFTPTGTPAGGELDLRITEDSSGDLVAQTTIQVGGGGCPSCSDCATGGETASDLGGGRRQGNDPSSGAGIPQNQDTDDEEGNLRGGNMFHGLNLGQGADGAGTMELFLNMETLGDHAADPAALDLRSVDGAIVDTSDPPMWFETKDAFTKITEDLGAGRTGYHISFYKATDHAGSGSLVGGATPFKKVLVERISDSGNYRRLDVKNVGTIGKLDRRFLYTEPTSYTADKVWKLVEVAKGQSLDNSSNWLREVTVTTTNVGATSDYASTIEIKGSDGHGGTGLTTLSHVTETYRRYAFGDRLVKREVKVNTTPDYYTTTYEYYAATDPDVDGLLKSRVDPDGGWVYHVYDGEGRLEHKFTPFGNTAFNTSSPPVAGSSESGTRRTTWDYDGSGYVARRIDYASGTPVAASYYTETSGVYKIHECHDLPGSYGSVPTTGTLVTEITQATTGTWEGRVEDIVHPDGTASAFDYFRDTTAPYVDHLTVTEDRGSWSGSTFEDGVRTITVTNPAGHVIGLFKYAVQNGTVSSTPFHSEWASPVRDQETGTRPLRIQDTLSGLYRVTYWSGCCGAVGETDYDGTTTSRTFDSFNRVVSEEVGFLGAMPGASTPSNAALQSGSVGTFASTLSSATFIRDGMGRRTVVQENPISGGGGSITTETNEYNLAGELTESEDAAGVVTHYSTVHPPGGGTRRFASVEYKATLAGSVVGYRTTLQEHDADGTLALEHVFASSSAGSLSVDTANGGTLSKMAFETKLVPGHEGLVRRTASAGTGTLSTATEWFDVYSDPAGRTVKKIYADSATETWTYSGGRLTSFEDAGDVRTFYTYTDDGEPYETIVDADHDDSIDTGDYGTRTTREFIDDTGTANDCWRTTRQMITVTGAGTVGMTTSIQEVDTDAVDTRAWSNGSQATATALSRTAPGSYTVTTTHPDSSKTKATYSSGRVISRERIEAGGSSAASGTYSSYDDFGRVSEQWDLRVGSANKTTFSYNDRHEVDEVVAPGPGAGSATTTTAYDSLGNLVSRALPGHGAGSPAADREQTWTYYWTGKLKAQGGYGQYGAEYTYDPHGGRMKTMTTEYGSASSSTETEWFYDGQRGWLTEKHDGENKGATYQYDGAGRMTKRTWERGKTTYYDRDAAGRVEGVQYWNNSGMTVDDPDTTDITYTYDDYGRLETVTDATGTRTFDHVDSDSSGSLATHDVRPSTETFGSSNLFADVVVTRDYESASPYRYAGFHVGTTYDIDYEFDDLGRLYRVKFDNRYTTYTYAANSESLLQHTQLGHALGAGTPPAITDVAFTAERSWEARRDVLDSISNYVGAHGGAGSVRSSFDYTVNDIGQRTDVDMAGLYYASGDGYDYGYTDDTGELEVANFLNSATPSRDRSFDYDALGNRLRMDDDTDVTSGSAFATYAPNNQNEYATVDSTSYSYDLDGNLLDNGTYQFIWDGENRIIEVRKNSGATLMATYTYDYLGRRVRKEWTSAVYGGPLDWAFLYDGWNVAIEYAVDTANDVIDTADFKYAWGLDLSGSIHGAGGVGGLLAVDDADEAATYYYAYDGNGNVVKVLDEDGIVKAHYEYNPFGTHVDGAGPYRFRNRFRFSTKYIDAENNTYYYGYRQYDPVTGRWLSRDPIGENGGLNLYGFVLNRPSTYIDVLGLTLPEPPKGESYPCVVVVFDVRKDTQHGWLAAHADAGIRTAKNRISMTSNESHYGGQYFDNNGNVTARKQQLQEHERARHRLRIWQCCCIEEKEAKEIWDRIKRLQASRREIGREVEEAVRENRAPNADILDAEWEGASGSRFADGCAYRASWAIGGNCGVPDWSLPNTPNDPAPNSPSLHNDGSSRVKPPTIPYPNPSNQFHGPMLLERDIAQKSSCKLVYGENTL